jgi:hypothetical protein
MTRDIRVVEGKFFTVYFSLLLNIAIAIVSITSSLYNSAQSLNNYSALKW